MIRLVLASTSPRRQQLLDSLAIPYDIVAPDFEEVLDPFANPEELAMRLAKGKATSVLPSSGGAQVTIGADTFLELDGTYLGKPRDAAHAVEQLRSLCGREHHVVTGCAIVASNGQVDAFAVTSSVWLRPLTDHEIEAYVATGEPLDKAGSYALQGRGAAFVERVDGDVSGIIGLPLSPLAIKLQAMGFSPWTTAA